MLHRFLSIATPRTLVASCMVIAACSSSSSTTTPPGTDAGHPHDSSTFTVDTGAKTDTGTMSGKDSGKTSTDASKDAPEGTMTIAAARQSNPTGSITVKGFVTALAGVPGDYPQWYIEDPEGGEYSGVDVYCDPLVTKACKVTEPALHDLILVTGTLTTYKGQLELEPTAMTVLQSDAPAPPVMSLTAADIAPTGNSPYRGVYVQLIVTAPTKLVVDSVTPAALADTGCGAVLDAGTPACTSLCEPPLYSGFQANDGTGNEVYIEAPFFHTDPLQSSPECLTQPGVVPVKVGTTFTKMSGILDVDPYASAQALSPVLPSDYSTP